MQIKIPGGASPVQPERNSNPLQAGKEMAMEQIRLVLKHYREVAVMMGGASIILAATPTSGRPPAVVRLVPGTGPCKTATRAYSDVPIIRGLGFRFAVLGIDCAQRLIQGATAPHSLSPDPVERKG